MQAPPFHVCYLSMVFFGLSSMIDSGAAAGVTLDDVKRHAQNGTLLDFLNKRVGGSFAMGILDAEQSFAKWYLDNIKDQCIAMSDREQRKYAIENNGIALLISYTAEILQQGANLRLS